MKAKFQEAQAALTLGPRARRVVTSRHLDPLRQVVYSRYHQIVVLLS